MRVADPPPPALADRNDRKFARYARKARALIAVMERERMSGEVVLRLVVQNGGIGHWKVESSEGGQATDGEG